jgi:hypothetical protein
MLHLLPSPLADDHASPGLPDEVRDTLTVSPSPGARRAAQGESLRLTRHSPSDGVISPARMSITSVHPLTLTFTASIQLPAEI